MKKFLKKIAEERTVLFWCLSMIAFMILGYKAFSTFFLGKTGYTWDVTFLRLSILLIVILMMREIYSGEFYFNFRTGNFFKALLLLWPSLIYMGLNLLGEEFSHPIVFEGFMMILIETLVIGLYEEVVVRGFLVGHMMYYWKNDRRVLSKSVFWSAVIFGVLHLGNLFSGRDALSTIIQVIYATILGVLFAAVYIRTRNLWAVAVIHGFIDFTGDIRSIFVAPQAVSTEVATKGMNLVSIIVVLIASLFTLCCALFMLRKKKHNEILQLWKEIPLYR